ncbi:MAG: hypothetical protein AAF211_33055 [Myxococcota bacterium]
MIALLAGWLLGCGGPSVDCAAPTDVLATVQNARLTCRRADWLVEYWELLRAAPLSAGDRRLVRKALVQRFGNDPSGTTGLLDRVRTAGSALASQWGSEATRARSTAIYDALHGTGVVSGDGELGRLQARLLPVWGESKGARLVLTEADVEGWIRYASLCREIQGGTALRISVADRVSAYRVIRERFAGATTVEQAAMAALGAAWPQIEQGWLSADYAAQQGFAGVAPLPGPLETNSIGYLAEIVGGDVTGHVAALETHFGPFTVTPDRPMFQAEHAPSR